jgi:alpha-L-fucosidase 2
MGGMRDVTGWAVLGIMAPCLYAQAASTAPVLWYTRPAAVWNEALPLGNGHLGAMVFGGGNSVPDNGDLQDPAKNADILDGSKTRAQDEHLQVNESTVWQGSRTDRLNPEAHEGFLNARQLLLDSKGTNSKLISEAEEILSRTMISSPKGMPGYSTLGDLYIRSSETGQATDYRRELNLQTGLLRVVYSLGGSHFVREVFASAPDKVIVVHLAADKPASLSFSLSMDRPADFKAGPINTHDVVLTPGPAHQDQISFQGQVRILNTGGSTKVEGPSIVVKDATEVTLLFTAATDFRGGTFTGESPGRQCSQILDRAAGKSYIQLRDAATTDVSHWMSRVSLHLGESNPELEALPDDERLRRVSAGGNDLGLQALYFQFARYLLVSSSRPDGLPANLQGLWASGINNPWGSKYTININTEMNYWMAEAANLGELHTTLFNLVDMARAPGSGTAVEVAKKYYDARGFVIHHNTDIWGDANPIDGVPYGIWPMGGAWLTLHAWDHYAFNGDREFLRSRAWPLLHDASLFFLDYLVDDGHGHLVTGPSLSPENRYRLPDGSTHSISMGPTMDIEITRELFERTLQAGALLHEDPRFLAQVESAMDRLPPFRIGHLGNLQEWQLDYDDAAKGHRHISHLWALFPGTQIDPQHTPELAKAAQNSLETRLRNGGGQTGWSRAWVVNYWDHLDNGDRAYESMQVLFRQSTFPNMMDTHPPGVFQIDGNLGGANGMLDALVQSRWYPDHSEVDLLPALPGEWKDGDITGIRVRGGGELALRWRSGKLVSVKWLCTHSGNFDVRLPSGQSISAVLADGKTISVPVGTAATRLAMTQGMTYTFKF